MKALLCLSTNNIIGEVSETARANPGQVLVPLTEEKPAHNPETQDLVCTGFRVSGAQAFRTYTVRDLSQSEIYEKKQAAGFVDPVLGIKLKTTERANAKFAQQFTLIRGAIGMAKLTEDSPVTFFDFLDKPHTLPASVVSEMLLRYGFYNAQIHAEFSP